MALSKLSFSLISYLIFSIRLASPFSKLPRTRLFSKKPQFSLFDGKLDQLLHRAKIISPAISTLSGGFCNFLYSIKVGRKEYVAKLLSPMALDRLPASSSFQVDLLASSNDVGPRVIEYADDGILMEFLDGTSLNEDDVHNANNFSTLYNIAKQLKKLHSFQTACQGPNMLWYSLEAMLKDSLDKNLRDEFHFQKSTIVPLMPKSSLVCGHGDFKPSNIYITKEHNAARFIDFELSGLNYRGFDIAKLFRKEGRRNMENRRLFIDSYLEDSNDCELLQLETAVFDPLTWFEAAAFFDYAARIDDPRNAEQWRALYSARITCYEASLKDFETSVAALREHAVHRGLI